MQVTGKLKTPENTEKKPDYQGKNQQSGKLKGGENDGYKCKV